MKISKRELVMLIFLILIAVVFIEYRFVITPSIERYDALTDQKSQVEAQVDAIKLNLAIAKQNEEKRDENLDEIEKLAKRYFGELQMDALLVRTHDLFLEEGFDPSQYQIHQLATTTLSPEIADSFDMAYELKNLAETYRSLNDPTAEPEDSEADTTEPVTGDQVEQYMIGINATGTYDEVRSFLDAINGMQRSVVISSVSMVPDLAVQQPEEPDEEIEPEPEEPEITEPEEQKLTVQIMLNYYGITQLVPSEETFNSWYREPFESITDTPFKQPVPEETTEETTEGTIETEETTEET